MPQGAWKEVLRELDEAEGRAQAQQRMAKSLGTNRRQNPPQTRQGEEQEQRVILTRTMYGACIGHMNRNRHWQITVDILERMIAMGIPPDEFCVKAGVKACSMDGQWEKALDLLRDMEKGRDRTVAGARQGANGTPSTLASNTAAVATVETGIKPNSRSVEPLREPWEAAVKVVGRVRDVGWMPAVATYNSAMTTCSKSKRWREVLELLREMRQTVR